MLGPSTLEGRSVIGKAYRRSFASSRTTKHLVTNMAVQPSELGSARARPYLFVVGLKEELLSISWGTYECLAKQQGSGWLIDELAISLDVPFLNVPVTVKSASKTSQSLDTEDLISIVSRYLGALERFDLKEAASCFTENAFYSHPPYSVDDNGGRRHEVRGHSDLIALFEKRGLRSVKHEIQHGRLGGWKWVRPGCVQLGGAHRVLRANGHAGRGRPNRLLCRVFQYPGGRGVASESAARADDGRGTDFV